MPENQRNIGNFIHSRAILCFQYFTYIDKVHFCLAEVNGLLIYQSSLLYGSFNYLFTQGRLTSLLSNTDGSGCRLSRRQLSSIGWSSDTSSGWTSRTVLRSITVRRCAILFLANGTHITCRSLHWPIAVFLPVFGRPRQPTVGGNCTRGTSTWQLLSQFISYQNHWWEKMMMQQTCYSDGKFQYVPTS